MNDLAIIRSLFDRPLLGRLGTDTGFLRNMLGMDPSRELTDIEGTTLGFWPKVEMKETKDSIVCSVDVPGIKEKDVSVVVSGNQLTVSGKRESDKRDQNDTFYTYERHYGTFKRTLTLPETVDVEHVAAALEDGVLSIVLPKKSEHAAKRIAVKAGAKLPRS
jgi:HSP20 family protein